MSAYDKLYSIVHIIDNQNISVDFSLLLSIHVHYNSCVDVSMEMGTVSILLQATCYFRHTVLNTVRKAVAILCLLQ